MTKDLLIELIEVLEKLGRINEALSVSKDLLLLQTNMYNKKKDFSIFRIQSKLELQMKEREIELQSEILKQKEKHNQELTQANADLDKFVGMASHDLKEPIRTINSFTNLLSKHIKEDDKEYEFFSYIEDACKRMTFLVDDLLAYARSGKLDYPMKSVNLNIILDISKKNLLNRIEKSNAIITVKNELPTIITHNTPMLQLFQNIIGNAIKYRQKNITPEVIIEYQKQENNHLISFADNGLGIKEDMLKKIFDPFVRIHRKDMKKGSGIGLATCKRIIEQYHGRLWATSALGKGSTFYIELPFNDHQTDNECQ